MKKLLLTCLIILGLYLTIFGSMNLADDLDLGPKDEDPDTFYEVWVLLINTITNLFKSD